MIVNSSSILSIGFPIRGRLRPPILLERERKMLTVLSDGERAQFDALLDKLNVHVARLVRDGKL